MALNMGQWLSIPFVIIGVFLVFRVQILSKLTAWKNHSK